ncbi:MAG: periplasmic heavy metal sensor [Pseudomonadota bacterium]
MDRGIVFALAASLFFNIFLGGFIAGNWLSQKKNAFGAGTSTIEQRQTDASGASKSQLDQRDSYQRGTHRGKRPPRGDILGEALFLSPEARAAVRNASRGRGAEIRQHWEEVSRLRLNARKALAADPFDREAAERALTALIQHRATSHEGRTSLMLDVFESLSIEERRALLEKQEQRANERRRRRRRFDGSRADPIVIPEKLPQ